MLALSLVVLHALCVRPSRQQSTTDPSTLLPSYDYIVCGGGTAGLTVATRLSEDADVTVLVVEAGGATDNDNWNYPSGPEVFAGGKFQDLPAGKVLGGSSAINGRVYLRAEAAQIDDWEKIGNPGWNWDNLFPYYLKSETIAQPDQRQAAAGMAFDPAFHGTDGPVSTGWPVNIVAKGYLDLLQATYPLLGVPVSKDLNGGDMHGISTYPRTQRNVDGQDVQESSRTAYYEPVMASRPNLDVITETTARRIIWGGAGAGAGANSTKSAANSTAGVRAAGVEIASNGTTLVVQARREVILSAGSYRTPSILEYSGVGNPGVLAPLGIDVAVDLPGVGEHLMDQTNNILSFFLAPNFTYPEGADTAFVAFVTARDVWGADGAADVAAETLAALPAYAESLAARNRGATSAADLLRLLRVQYDTMFVANATVAEVLHGLQLRGDRLECEFWSSLPFSRGSVHVTGADPPTGTDRPAGLAIANNFFLLDYDVRAQVGAARAVRRLFGTAPLNGSASVGEIAPGLATVPLDDDDDDDEWAAWLKAEFRSAWHPVGSAAMMPRAVGGVVDPALRVYGTANVRVVDASLFPFQVNGHPSSTVYAVAERAADIIKGKI